MEIWKPMIYNGEDYSEWIEVSNKGNVRNSKTNKLRKLNLLKTGYLFVSFSMGSRSRKKTIRVHKAVLESFVKNEFNKPQVNHIDGNKQNNNLSNLEWVSQSENINHAIKNKLLVHTKGSKHANSKLTDEEVKWIRDNYIPRDSIFGSRAIARKYNIHHTTILSLLKGETYDLL